MKKWKDEIVIVSGFIMEWEYGLFAIHDTVFKRKSFRDISENWYHSDCYWMVLK